MNENKFWLSLWLGLAAIVFTGASVLMWIDFQSDKYFVNHGYTRAMLVGSSMVQWVKP